MGTFDYNKIGEIVKGLEPAEQERLLKLARDYEESVRARPLEGYIPHDKQKEFHDALHENLNEKWYIAGNRSGKTVAGATEVAIHATGQYPDWWEGKKLVQPIDAWCVSLDSNVQRDVAQAEILQWLGKGEIKDIKHTTRGIIDFIELNNGSKIGFKNVEQGREKFQGTSKDLIWFDEEPSKEVYEECYARIIDRSGLILGTMTPLKGFSWIFTDILQDSHKESSRKVVIKGSMYDNKYLPMVEVEAYEEGLDEKMKKMRIYGEFVMFEGLVYDTFDMDTHLVNRFDVVKLGWPVMAGIDFGDHNPTAMVLLTFNKDTWFVIDQYSACNLSVEEHAGAMLSILSPYREQIVRIVGDPAGKAMIREYQRYGLYIQKGDNSVLAGIARVKSLLLPRVGVQGKMSPRLHVFNDLDKIIEEFGLYRWADRKRNDDGLNELDRPEKKSDHLMDALRYTVMTINAKDLTKITSPGMPVLRSKRRWDFKKLKGYR